MRKNKYTTCEVCDSAEIESYRSHGRTIYLCDIHARGLHVGRPQLFEKPMIKRSVTWPQDYDTAAIELGNGCRSQGARFLVEAYWGDYEVVDYLEGAVIVDDSDYEYVVKDGKIRTVQGDVIRLIRVSSELPFSDQPDTGDIPTTPDDIPFEGEPGMGDTWGVDPSLMY
jgi:hypothetical protein